MRLLILLCAIPSLICLSSCGYHVGAKADLMPKSVHTIAIPTFVTNTTRYKLIDSLPQEIGREFSARTRYAVTTDPSQADAVLYGTINSAIFGASIYDPTSGKPTSVQVVVVLSVRLVDQHSNQVVFSRPNWVVRQNYEIAVDPHQFFNESSPAFDRLSQDVARDIVSSIVENF